MSILNQFTDDQIIKANESSSSIKEALSVLGLGTHTKYYQWYKTNCVRLEIAPPTYVRDSDFTRKYSNEELFVENARLSITGQQLKKRLISDFGWSDQCQGIDCPSPEPIWAGKKLTIQLDHINGTNNDNRLENLRLLCPNCHTQTDTFSGKRRPTPRDRSVPCPTCSNSKSYKAIQCKNCSPSPNRGRTKIEWPSKETILSLIDESNVHSVSKILGVSGNAIRKHMKTNYGLVV